MYHYELRRLLGIETFVNHKYVRNTIFFQKNCSNYRFSNEIKQLLITFHYKYFNLQKMQNFCLAFSSTLCILFLRSEDDFLLAEIDLNVKIKQFDVCEQLLFSADSSNDVSSLFENHIHFSNSKSHTIKFSKFLTVHMSKRFC